MCVCVYMCMHMYVCVLCVCVWYVYDCSQLYADMHMLVGMYMHSNVAVCVKCM